MYWRVVISLIFIGFTKSYAQDLEKTYGLANAYMTTNDYTGAKALYNRVVYFDSTNSYVNSYYRLGEIAVHQEKYKEAKEYFALHANWMNSDSVRVQNTFNTVLCCFMLNEYKEALQNLFLIKSRVKNDSLLERWKLHVAVAYFQDGQYDKSKELFSELVSVESRSELDKIFKKNNRLEKKFNRFKVQLMSVFLPGSGQVFTGNVGPGINSFVLVGSFLYLFTRVIKVLSLPDAILAVYPWLSRYYMGGVKKAGNFADERIKIKRSSYYQQILILARTSY